MAIRRHKARHKKEEKKQEPGKGKKFNFHGAFSKKEDAMAREKEVNGFIEEKEIKGHKRFVVLTNKN